MAMVVEAKKVKKAAAKVSKRLVNSPNPFSGKPKIVPPAEPSLGAGCVI
jgi:hypothetical protein